MGDPIGYDFGGSDFPQDEPKWRREGGGAVEVNKMTNAELLTAHRSIAANTSQWEVVMAAETELLRRLEHGQGAQPDGYAYRYADGIRFTDSRTINGGEPIEAIPYYFGNPATPPEQEYCHCSNAFGDGRNICQRCHKPMSLKQIAAAPPEQPQGSGEPAEPGPQQTVLPSGEMLKKLGLHRRSLQINDPLPDATKEITKDGQDGKPKGSGEHVQGCVPGCTGVSCDCSCHCWQSVGLADRGEGPDDRGPQQTVVPSDAMLKKMGLKPRGKPADPAQGQMSAREFWPKFIRQYGARRFALLTPTEGALVFAEAFARSWGERPHVGECNYQTQPIGSPGCLCVVVNRNELRRIMAAPALPSPKELENYPPVDFTRFPLDVRHKLDEISVEILGCAFAAEEMRGELFDAKLAERNWRWNHAMELICGLLSSDKVSKEATNGSKD